MNKSLRFVCGLSVLICVAMPSLHADELRMHNGDSYFGTLVSVSTNSLVFESEVLGRIRLRREQVAVVAFGTNTAPATALHTAGDERPAKAASSRVPGSGSVGTNTDVSTVLHSLGANAGSIQQVRDQMLMGNPEAAGKYDELVNGLLGGELNLDDLRREAESSADQLRELKRDLGPEVGDSLDLYLQVLDGFIEETAPESSKPSP